MTTILATYLNLVSTRKLNPKLAVENVKNLRQFIQNPQKSQELATLEYPVVERVAKTRV